MKVKPLYDRVVVMPEKVSEVSNFGIIIPKLAVSKSCVGKVMQVGDGQTFDGNKVDMQVKVGDRVIFSKFGALEVEIEKEKYLILRQADILCVLTKE